MESEKKPRISVIMPVFNREDYLSEAIESILNQTFIDFEFIIVDDGSTDRSVNIIKSYAKKDIRIKFLYNKFKKGIVGGLQTAIESANGEYVVRMDSDDISLPQRLETQVNFMDKNLDVGACGSWVKLIGDNEGVIWKLPVDAEIIKATMLFCGAIANPTAIIRKTVFTEMNFNYDEFYTVAEDFDFWTRISRVVKLANIPEILLLYRNHHKNTNHTNKKEHLELLKKIMLRQINELGICPTENELRLHYMIGKNDIIWEINIDKKITAWFKKIIIANKEKRVFNQKCLVNIIDKKKEECAENIKNILSISDDVGKRMKIVILVGRVLKIFLGDGIVGRLFLIVQKIYSLFLRAYEYVLNNTEKIRVFLGFGTKLSKSVKKDFKIGMAILAHERPEYLELCLDSLFKTNLYNYNITFLINDDGSTDSKIKDIINKPRDVKYKIIRNFTPKGPNCAGAAINKAVKKLMEIDDFDIIGWCDSDALFHPEWLDQTMKICLWAKKKHKYHVLGPFSSFNSSDYKFHKILGTYNSPYGSYVVKRQMGMLNYFYFKDDFIKLGYFSENKDDETLMTKYFEKLGVRNFCTKTSYVEHLGQESVLNQWRPTKVRRAVHGMYLARGNWGYDLEKISPYAYYKYLKNNDSFGLKCEKSESEVDIIIPAIKKDLDVLPSVIESTKKYLQHPIDKIFIIGPNSREIIEFCEKYKLSFLDEDSVLPIKLRDIKYFVKGIDRSGWIFQQLLKLNADKISNKKFAYIIDADTILVQPQVFEKNKKSILLASDEFHAPYYDTFEKIFGYPAVAKFSFIAHQMFFDLTKLKEMKVDMENKNSQTNWYKVILNNLDHNQISSFSEYETYGNWMLINYPENIITEYWHNRSLSKNRLHIFKSYLGKKIQNYRSISFHSYNECIFSKIVFLCKKIMKL